MEMEKKPLNDEEVLKKELEEIEREEQEINAKLQAKEKLREKKERLSNALKEIDSKKTPRDKGREAFLSSKGLKDNPYSVISNDQKESHGEWLQGWIEAHLGKFRPIDFQAEMPSSYSDRLDSIEQALKKLQPPEDEGFESVDKIVSKAVNKVTINAESQIRRARRYIVTTAIISSLLFLAIAATYMIY